MFGYVKPVEKELLVKDLDFYRSTYCGICRAMQKYTGAPSSLGLSYDSVFLALVRMCYEREDAFSAKMCRCIAHPIKKRCVLCENSATAYTAKAFSLLTLGKLEDDLHDEPFAKTALRRAALPIFRRAVKKAGLPELEAFVKEKLSAIRALEEAKTPSVDAPAALFGELLGEVFSYGLSDGARTVTRTLGDALGRFIYAADAAEDYEKDRKNGSYNPYVLLYEGKDLTPENKNSIRTALILECRQMEQAVDLLPFAHRATVERLIRNTIYLGLVRRISFLETPDA